MTKRMSKTVKDILAKNDQIQLLDSSPAAPKKSTASKRSSAELAFELEYLEPRLEEGVSVLWLAQPSIRMVGQTYTPDYLELSIDGLVSLIEVKGGFRLGSEDRSSVKARWANSVYANEKIHFFRARKDKAGRWKMRQIKTERAKIK